MDEKELSNKELDEVSGGSGRSPRSLCLVHRFTKVYKSPSDKSGECIGHVNAGTYILGPTQYDPLWVKIDLSINSDVIVDRSRTEGNAAYIKDAEVRWK